MSDTTYIGKFNAIVRLPYANRIYCENNIQENFIPPVVKGFLIQDNGSFILQDNGSLIEYT